MEKETGFKDLLTSLMQKRWYVTVIVLGLFVLMTAGIFAAIMMKTPMAAEWKELLLLLLGAFIGSYGKIIDYYYSDSDKDKLLVAKMDEENDTPEILLAKMDKGISSGDLKSSTPPPAPAAVAVPSPAAVATTVTPVAPVSVGVEVDEDGDGVMDGIDYDGDGVIDEYFSHRNCQHIWGDSDHDGHDECQICGLLKEQVEG